jgi:hypothetical protein
MLGGERVKRRLQQLIDGALPVASNPKRVAAIGNAHGTIQHQNAVVMPRYGLFDADMSFGGQQIGKGCIERVAVGDTRNPRTFGSTIGFDEQRKVSTLQEGVQRPLGVDGVSNTPVF